MKKMIAVLAAVAALAVAAAAPASSQAACRTVKCFNSRIALLSSQVAQQSAQMAELKTALNCLQPVAVSRYPGYDYNGYAAATTALDFTESGDEVSAWVLNIQPGTCGAPHYRTAAATSAAAGAPLAPFQAAPSTTLAPKTTRGGGR
jgi:hypothetical protein